MLNERALKIKTFILKEASYSFQIIDLINKCFFADAIVEEKKKFLIKKENETCDDFFDRACFLMTSFYVHDLSGDKLTPNKLKFCTHKMIKDIFGDNLYLKRMWKKQNNLYRLGVYSWKIDHNFEQMKEYFEKIPFNKECKPVIYFMLGYYYEEIKKNEARAIENYEKGYLLHCSASTFRLLCYYYHKKEISKMKELVMNRPNDKNANIFLANYYIHEEDDYKQYKLHYEKVGEMCDYEEVSTKRLLELSQNYLSEDDNEIIKCLTIAVARNNVEAMKMLAEHHLVITKKVDVAIKYFEMYMLRSKDKKSWMYLLGASCKEFRKYTQTQLQNEKSLRSQRKRRVIKIDDDFFINSVSKCCTTKIVKIKRLLKKYKKKEILEDLESFLKDKYK